MTYKTLSAGEVGLPAFDPGDRIEASIFDLSSHSRAREALVAALAMPDDGFNVFVLGDDRSGRLSATVSFLEDAVSDRPAPDDWIYVNNFQKPWEPVPIRLPAGEGRRFRDAMNRLVAQLSEAVRAAFGGEAFQARLREESDAAKARINAEMEAVRNDARAAGLDIVQSPQGPMIVAVGDDGQPVAPTDLTDEQQQSIERHAEGLADEVRRISRGAAEMQAMIVEHARDLGRQTADDTCSFLIQAVASDFDSHAGIVGWLSELRNDIIENYHIFLPTEEGQPRPMEQGPSHRYGVNLFVDNAGERDAPVVVEANPTYERLFGRIEYRQTSHVLDTDFTLIRAGAIHRANNGFLVLRADAVAAAPGIWGFLKAALRDSEARIEEPYRAVGPAVAGAPTPGPIPLDIKVVLVGSPRWYYTFFSADPEFQGYFKIKADIDPDMDATPENVATYGGLIRQMVEEAGGARLGCDDAAVSYLLALASRWASDRHKLTSRFEMVHDVVAEAALIAHEAGASAITRDHAADAVARRRHRNARIEERIQEGISQQAVLISTDGSKAGQVNALTVRNVGDHEFGTPSRVTASSSVGRRGVINIERDVALGGPIQQKGAMVLQGWLSRKFANRYPLSFNCSITFEQSYGGVDGDSASLAELLAILSDLSDIPLRQDLAITGSVNQHGEAQTIGGANHKIEGFFYTCRDAGVLDGRHGVAVPAANERNLVLRQEVAAAVDAGEFAIYSVETIDDAVALFTGRPAEEVFQKVIEQLDGFDAILKEREAG